MAAPASRAAGAHGPEQRRTLSRPTLSPLPVHVLDRFLHRFGTGTHQHDNPLGIRCAEVIEQPIVPAGQRGEAIHALLHDAGKASNQGFCASRHWKKVSGFCAVPRSTGCSGDRARWRWASISGWSSRACSVLLGEWYDLGDLVRSAKAVEKVEHRNTPGQGRGRGDGRHVLRFLYRIGGE